MASDGLDIKAMVKSFPLVLVHNVVIKVLINKIKHIVFLTKLKRITVK